MLDTRVGSRVFSESELLPAHYKRGIYLMNTMNYSCPNCGASSNVMPENFTPVHFTGRLSQLSEGYCTVNCARLALNGLIALNAMSGGKLAASLERVK